MLFNRIRDHEQGIPHGCPDDPTAPLPECPEPDCRKVAGHNPPHFPVPGDGTPDSLRGGPTAPLPDDELTDADKLRALATWFDRFDDWREASGKIDPGIQDYREVQTDLRRIADLLAALRAEPTAPLDVERLARALDAHMADFIREPESFDSSVLVAANVARHYAALAAQEEERP